jgi:hypothetical protein
MVTFILLFVFKILIILIHVKETKKIQTKSQFLQEELAIKYQIITVLK